MRKTVQTILRIKLILIIVAILTSLPFYLPVQSPIKNVFAQEEWDCVDNYRFKGYDEEGVPTWYDEECGGSSDEPEAEPYVDPDQDYRDDDGRNQADPCFARDDDGYCLSEDDYNRISRNDENYCNWCVEVKGGYCLDGQPLGKQFCVEPETPPQCYIDQESYREVDSPYDQNQICVESLEICPGDNYNYKYEDCRDKPAEEGVEVADACVGYSGCTKASYCVSTIGEDGSPQPTCVLYDQSLGQGYISYPDAQCKNDAANKEDKFYCDGPTCFEKSGSWDEEIADCRDTFVETDPDNCPNRCVGNTVTSGQYTPPEELQQTIQAGGVNIDTSQIRQRCEEAASLNPDYYDRCLQEEAANQILTLSANDIDRGNCTQEQIDSCSSNGFACGDGKCFFKQHDVCSDVIDLPDSAEKDVFVKACKQLDAQPQDKLEQINDQLRASNPDAICKEKKADEFYCDGPACIQKSSGWDGNSCVGVFASTTSDNCPNSCKDNKDISGEVLTKIDCSFFQDEAAKKQCEEQNIGIEQYQRKIDQAIFEAGLKDCTLFQQDVSKEKCYQENKKVLDVLKRYNALDCSYTESCPEGGYKACQGSYSEDGTCRYKENGVGCSKCQEKAPDVFSEQAYCNEEGRCINGPGKACINDKQCLKPYLAGSDEAGARCVFNEKGNDGKFKTCVGKIEKDSDGFARCKFDAEALSCSQPVEKEPDLVANSIGKGDKQNRCSEEGKCLNGPGYVCTGDDECLKQAEAQKEKFKQYAGASCPKPKEEAGKVSLCYGVISSEGVCELKEDSECSSAVDKKDYNPESDKAYCDNGVCKDGPGKICKVDSQCYFSKAPTEGQECRQTQICDLDDGSQGEQVCKGVGSGKICDLSQGGGSCSQCQPKGTVRLNKEATCDASGACVGAPAISGCMSRADCKQPAPVVRAVGGGVRTVSESVCTEDIDQAASSLSRLYGSKTAEEFENFSAVSDLVNQKAIKCVTQTRQVRDPVRYVVDQTTVRVQYFDAVQEASAANNKYFVTLGNEGSNSTEIDKAAQERDLALRQLIIAQKNLGVKEGSTGDLAGKLITLTANQSQVNEELDKRQQIQQLGLDITIDIPKAASARNEYNQIIAGGQAPDSEPAVKAYGVYADTRDKAQSDITKLAALRGESGTGLSQLYQTQLDQLPTKVDEQSQYQQAVTTNTQLANVTRNSQSPEVIEVAAQAMNGIAAKFEGSKPEVAQQIRTQSAAAIATGWTSVFQNQLARNEDALSPNVTTSFDKAREAISQVSAVDPEAGKKLQMRLDAAPYEVVAQQAVQQLRSSITFPRDYYVNPLENPDGAGVAELDNTKSASDRLYQARGQVCQISSELCGQFVEKYGENLEKVTAKAWEDRQTSLAIRADLESQLPSIFNQGRYRAQGESISDDAQIAISNYLEKTKELETIDPALAKAYRGRLDTVTDQAENQRQKDFITTSYARDNELLASLNKVTANSDYSPQSYDPLKLSSEAEARIENNINEMARIDPQLADDMRQNSELNKFKTNIGIDPNAGIYAPPEIGPDGKPINYGAGCYTQTCNEESGTTIRNICSGKVSSQSFNAVCALRSGNLDPAKVIIDSQKAEESELDAKATANLQNLSKIIPYLASTTVEQKFKDSSNFLGGLKDGAGSILGGVGEAIGNWWEDKAYVARESRIPSFEGSLEQQRYCRSNYKPATSDFTDTGMLNYSPEYMPDGCSVDRRSTQERRDAFVETARKSGLVSDALLASQGVATIDGRAEDIIRKTAEETGVDLTKPINTWTSLEREKFLRGLDSKNSSLAKDVFTTIISSPEAWNEWSAAKAECVKQWGTEGCKPYYTYNPISYATLSSETLDTIKQKGGAAFPSLVNVTPEQLNLIAQQIQTQTIGTVGTNPDYDPGKSVIPGRNYQSTEDFVRETTNYLLSNPQYILDPNSQEGLARKDDLRLKSILSDPNLSEEERRQKVAEFVTEGVKNYQAIAAFSQLVIQPSASYQWKDEAESNFAFSVALDATNISLIPGLGVLDPADWALRGVGKVIGTAFKPVEFIGRPVFSAADNAIERIGAWNAGRVIDNEFGSGVSKVLGEYASRRLAGETIETAASILPQEVVAGIGKKIGISDISPTMIAEQIFEPTLAPRIAGTGATSAIEAELRTAAGEAVSILDQAKSVGRKLDDNERDSIIEGLKTRGFTQDVAEQIVSGKWAEKAVSEQSQVIGELAETEIKNRGYSLPQVKPKIVEAMEQSLRLSIKESDNEAIIPNVYRGAANEPDYLLRGITSLDKSTAVIRNVQKLVGEDVPLDQAWKGLSQEQRTQVIKAAAKDLATEAEASRIVQKQIPTNGQQAAIQLASMIKADKDDGVKLLNPSKLKAVIENSKLVQAVADAADELRKGKTFDELPQLQKEALTKFDISPEELLKASKGYTEREVNEAAYFLARKLKGEAGDANVAKLKTKAGREELLRNGTFTEEEVTGLERTGLIDRDKTDIAIFETAADILARRAGGTEGTGKEAVGRIINNIKLTADEAYLKIRQGRVNELTDSEIKALRQLGFTSSQLEGLASNLEILNPDKVTTFTTELTVALSQGFEKNSGIFISPENTTKFLEELIIDGRKLTPEEISIVQRNIGEQFSKESYSPVAYTNAARDASKEILTQRASQEGRREILAQRLFEDFDKNFLRIMNSEYNDQLLGEGIYRTREEIELVQKRIREYLADSRNLRRAAERSENPTAAWEAVRTEALHQAAQTSAEDILAGRVGSLNDIRNIGLLVRPGDSFIDRVLSTGDQAYVLGFRSDAYSRAINESEALVIKRKAEVDKAKKALDDAKNLVEQENALTKQDRSAQLQAQKSKITEAEEKLATAQERLQEVKANFSSQIDAQNSGELATKIRNQRARVAVAQAEQVKASVVYSNSSSENTPMLRIELEAANKKLDAEKAALSTFENTQRSTVESLRQASQSQIAALEDGIKKLQADVISSKSDFESLSKAPLDKNPLLDAAQRKVRQAENDLFVAQNALSKAEKATNDLRDLIKTTEAEIPKLEYETAAVRKKAIEEKSYYWTQFLDQYGESFQTPEGIEALKNGVEIVDGDKKYVGKLTDSEIMAIKAGGLLEGTQEYAQRFGGNVDSRFASREEFMNAVWDTAADFIITKGGTRVNDIATPEDLTIIDRVQNWFRATGRNFSPQDLTERAKQIWNRLTGRAESPKAPVTTEVKTIEEDPSNFSIETKGAQADLKKEDTIYPDTQNRGVAIVADGVSSGGNGGIASQKATQLVADRLNTIKQGFPIAGTSDIPRIEQEIKQALIDANTLVQKEAGGGKTTISAGVVIETVTGPRLFVANVGDSRVYVLRDSKLIQISKDVDVSFLPIEKQPAFIKALAEAKTEEELIRLAGGDTFVRGMFNRREIISEAIGDAKGLKLTEKNVFSYELKPGDKVIITSDGVHDNSTLSRMQELLNGGAGADELVEEARLTSLKGEYRSKEDDISAVVMDIKGTPKPATPAVEPLRVETPTAPVTPVAPTATVTTPVSAPKPKLEELPITERIESIKTQIEESKKAVSDTPAAIAQAEKEKEEATKIINKWRGPTGGEGGLGIFQDQLLRFNVPEYEQASQKLQKAEQTIRQQNEIAKNVEQVRLTNDLVATQKVRDASPTKDNIDKLIQEAESALTSEKRKLTGFQAGQISGETLLSGGLSLLIPRSIKNKIPGLSQVNDIINAQRAEVEKAAGFVEALKTEKKYLYEFADKPRPVTAPAPAAAVTVPNPTLTQRFKGADNGDSVGKLFATEAGRRQLVADSKFTQAEVDAIYNGGLIEGSPSYKGFADQQKFDDALNQIETQLKSPPAAPAAVPAAAPGVTPDVGAVPQRILALVRDALGTVGTSAVEAGTALTSNPVRTVGSAIRYSGDLALRFAEVEFNGLRGLIRSPRNFFSGNPLPKRVDYEDPLRFLLTGERRSNQTIINQAREELRRGKRVVIDTRTGTTTLLAPIREEQAAAKLKELGFKGSNSELAIEAKRLADDLNKPIPAEIPPPAPVTAAPANVPKVETPPTNGTAPKATQVTVTGQLVNEEGKVLAGSIVPSKVVNIDDFIKDAQAQGYIFEEPKGDFGGSGAKVKIGTLSTPEVPGGGLVVKYLANGRDNFWMVREIEFLNQVKDTGLYPKITNLFVDRDGKVVGYAMGKIPGKEVEGLIDDINRIAGYYDDGARTTILKNVTLDKRKEFIIQVLDSYRKVSVPNGDIFIGDQKVHNLIIQTIPGQQNSLRIIDPNLQVTSEHLSDKSIAGIVKGNYNDPAAKYRKLDEMNRFMRLVLKDEEIATDPVLKGLKKGISDEMDKFSSGNYDIRTPEQILDELPKPEIKRTSSIEAGTPCPISQAPSSILDLFIKPAFAANPCPVVSSPKGSGYANLSEDVIKRNIFTQDPSYQVEIAGKTYTIADEGYEYAGRTFIPIRMDDGRVSMVYHSTSEGSFKWSVGIVDPSSSVPEAGRIVKWPQYYGGKAGGDVSFDLDLALKKALDEGKVKIDQRAVETVIIGKLNDFGFVYPDLGAGSKAMRERAGLVEFAPVSSAPSFEEAMKQLAVSFDKPSSISVNDRAVNLYFDGPEYKARVIFNLDPNETTYITRVIGSDPLQKPIEAPVTISYEYKANPNLKVVVNNPEIVRDREALEAFNNIKQEVATNRYITEVSANEQYLRTLELLRSSKSPVVQDLLDISLRIGSGDLLPEEAGKNQGFIVFITNLLSQKETSRVKANFLEETRRYVEIEQRALKADRNLYREYQEVMNQLAIAGTKEDDYDSILIQAQLSREKALQADPKLYEEYKTAEARWEEARRAFNDAEEQKIPPSSATTAPTQTEPSNLETRLKAAIERRDILTKKLEEAYKVWIQRSEEERDAIDRALKVDPAKYAEYKTAKEISNSKRDDIYKTGADPFSNEEYVKLQDEVGKKVTAALQADPKLHQASIEKRKISEEAYREYIGFRDQAERAKVEITRIKSEIDLSGQANIGCSGNLNASLTSYVIDFFIKPAFAANPCPIERTALFIREVAPNPVVEAANKATGGWITNAASTVAKRIDQTLPEGVATRLDGAIQSIRDFRDRILGRVEEEVITHNRQALTKVSGPGEYLYYLQKDGRLATEATKTEGEIPVFLKFQEQNGFMKVSEVVLPKSRETEASILKAAEKFNGEPLPVTSLHSELDTYLQEIAEPFSPSYGINVVKLQISSSSDLSASFNREQFGGQIGEGHNGTVYGSNREMATKLQYAVIREYPTDKDGRLGTAVATLREIEALKKADGAGGLPKIFSIVADDSGNIIGYQMEKIKGKTLGEGRLTELTLKERLNFLTDLADAHKKTGGTNRGLFKQTGDRIVLDPEDLIVEETINSSGSISRRFRMIDYGMGPEEEMQYESELAIKAFMLGEARIRSLRPTDESIKLGNTLLRYIEEGKSLEGALEELTKNERRISYRKSENFPIIYSEYITLKSHYGLILFN